MRMGVATSIAVRPAYAIGLLLALSVNPARAQVHVWSETPQPIPETLPIKKGEPRPAGYQKGRRPMTGAMISAGSIFAGVYVVTAAAGLALSSSSNDDDDALLTVPIVGPMMVTRTDDPSMFLPIVSTVIQGSMTVLFVAAAIGEDVWIRNDLIDLSVAPTVDTTGMPGISLHGRF